MIGRRVERRSTAVLALRSEDKQTASQAFDQQLIMLLLRFGQIDEWCLEERNTLRSLDLSRSCGQISGLMFIQLLVNKTAIRSIRG